MALPAVEPLATPTAQAPATDLAALIRALHLLAPPDVATRRAIARLLNYDWREAAPPRSAEPAGKSDAGPLTDRLPSRASTPEPAAKDDDAGVLLTPQTHQPVALDSLFGWGGLEEAPELLKPTKSDDLLPLPHRPLLPDAQLRAVATSLLATARPSRDFDWPAVERRLRRGQLLDALPLLARPTLRRGVQVWLDYSDAMQPHWRDGVKLVDSLGRLLGQGRVTAHRFQLHPLAPRSQQLSWEELAAPPVQPEVPVLIVSNFGLAGELAVGPEAWPPLLRTLASQRCPVTALLPVAERFWPPWIRRYFPRSVEWDRNPNLRPVPQGSHRR